MVTTSFIRHTDVFTVAYRNYWWTACIGGLYFVLGFVAWGGTMAAIGSSGLFVAAGLAGLALHYAGIGRTGPLNLALVLAHLLVGQGVLIWQQAYLPLSDYTNSGNPADRDFLIYLVSALLVVTMSMFGGLRGAGLGLATHYGFIFNSQEPFSFKWVFPLLIAVVGVIVSTAFYRLDEAYARLESLANHDHLTGLLNRHRLQGEFDRLQRRARDVGAALLVIAWDLDDLKRVNDAEGHAAGDTYIRDFARALQSAVRTASGGRSGDAAFRVGGDEFISLHVDAPDGRVVVERVRRSCPPVSAGWIRCETLTLDRALTDADRALYANKQERKLARSGPATPHPLSS